MQQLREALKILAERVLILEHMIGVHGRNKTTGAGNGFSRLPGIVKKKVAVLGMCAQGPLRGQLDDGLLKEMFGREAAVVSLGLG